MNRSDETFQDRKSVQGSLNILQGMDCLHIIASPHQCAINRAGVHCNNLQPKTKQEH